LGMSGGVSLRVGRVRLLIRFSSVLDLG
jgi:hypothetical protein